MAARISRRRFLGFAGAATSLAAAGDVRRAGASTPSDAAETFVADVAVVGGGIAGLFAARLLKAAGASVVVLEAADAVGGRAGVGPTDRLILEGAPTAFVHDRHERLLRLADTVGVEVATVSHDGAHLDASSGVPRRFEGSQLTSDPEAEAAAMSSLGRLEHMAREVDPASPWSGVNAAIRDGRSLSAWIDDNLSNAAAARHLGSALATVVGAPPSEVSLLHVLTLIASVRDSRAVVSATLAPPLRLRGGSQHLVARMTVGMRENVRTSAPVRRIEHGPGGVVVSADGVVVKARRAILALAPAMTASIEFVPPLPVSRRELTHRMPMGNTATAVCAYPLSFWSGDGLSGRVVGDGAPIGCVYASRGAHGTSLLVSTLAAPAVRAWGALGARERRRVVLDALERWFGPPAARPSAYCEFDRQHDPWGAGGVAGFSPPGVLSAQGPALRAPVGPIHWAGTESARSWPGFLEGSLESAERAVEEIVASIGFGHFALLGA